MLELFSRSSLIVFTQPYEGGLVITRFAAVETEAPVSRVCGRAGEGGTRCVPRPGQRQVLDPIPNPRRVAQGCVWLESSHERSALPVARTAGAEWGKGSGAFSPCRRVREPGLQDGRWLPRCPTTVQLVQGVMGTVMTVQQWGGADGGI